MNTADYNPRIEADVRTTRGIEQWNQILVNNKTIDSIREIALNRNAKPIYKLGRKLHHTALPNGEVIYYQLD